MLQCTVLMQWKSTIQNVITAVLHSFLQYCNQFTNNKDTICSLKNHGKKCLLAIKRLYTKHNFCRFHFFFFSILFCLLVLESVSSQIPADGLTSGVFSVLAYLAYTCTFFNQCIWYSWLMWICREEIWENYEDLGLELFPSWQTDISWTFILLWLMYSLSLASQLFLVFPFSF